MFNFNRFVSEPDNPKKYIVVKVREGVKRYLVARPMLTWQDGDGNASEFSFKNAQAMTTSILTQSPHSDIRIEEVTV